MTDSAWGNIPAEALRNQILCLEDDDCITELYHPAPTILFCRVSGHFRAEHAEQLAHASTSGCAADAEIHYFCDWAQMNSYATAARRTMTDWGRAERRKLKTGLYICGTRIVEMGVNVAGVAMAVLGIRIRATNRADFVRALGIQINIAQGDAAAEQD